MGIFNDLKDIVRKKDKNYYEELYLLQDKVLKKIFSKHDCCFYLTGGTALNRFHSLNLRYSDDIDLFFNTDDKTIFHIQKEEILNNLSKIYEIRNEIELFGNYGFITKNNYVYFLYDKELKLKIQFVQDLRKMTNTKILKVNGIRIDNIENIFHNKIAAFFHRQTLKDFIDLIGISEKIDSVNWAKEIHKAKINKYYIITYQEFLNKFLDKLNKFKNNPDYSLKEEKVKLIENVSIEKIIHKAQEIAVNLTQLFAGEECKKRKRKTKGLKL